MNACNRLNNASFPPSHDVMFKRQSLSEHLGQSLDRRIDRGDPNDVGL